MAKKIFYGFLIALFVAYASFILYMKNSSKTSFTAKEIHDTITDIGAERGKPTQVRIVIANHDDYILIKKDEAKKLNIGDSVHKKANETQLNITNKYTGEKTSVNIYP